MVNVGKIYSILTTVVTAIPLLGTLFHTQLALIPLFHGIDVAIMSHHHQETTTLAEITPILWGMLLFFILPMLAIIATTFYKFKSWRSLHFGFTVLYSVLNFAHLVADLLVEPIAWYQIVLMLLLFLVGILLNIVSYQWLKIGSRDRRVATAK